ncbi:hypothetical protein D3C84_570620 [compost metagenome]
MLRALVAEIGFRRLHFVHVRRELNTLGIGINQPVIHLGGTRFTQQLLDDPLRFGVLAFAKVVIPNAPLGVGKIVGRPILIVESSPDLEFIVDGHRVVDTQVLHGFGDVAYVALEGEFGRMDANHHQPLIAVFFSPGFYIGQAAQAVDAGVSPEIHQHYLALQRLGIEWWRVEPLHGAIQRWQLAFDGQCARRFVSHIHRTVSGRVPRHHRLAAVRCLTGQTTHQRLLDTTGRCRRKPRQNPGI